MASASLKEDIAIEAALKNTATGYAAAKSGAGAVPVIDMTSPDAAEQMWEAAGSVGFFTLVNHGVPESVIRAAFAASAGFFARDIPTKKAESPFAPHLNSGYEFMSQVRPSTGTADQKESLQITAREGSMDSRWPTAPAELQPAARELLDASHALACSRGVPV